MKWRKMGKSTRWLMNDIKHVALLFQSTKSSILLGVGLTNWVYTSTSNLTPHAEGTFGTAAPLFFFLPDPNISWFTQWTGRCQIQHCLWDRLWFSLTLSSFCTTWGELRILQRPSSLLQTVDLYSGLSTLLSFTSYPSLLSLQSVAHDSASLPHQEGIATLPIHPHKQKQLQL